MAKHASIGIYFRTSLDRRGSRLERERVCCTQPLRRKRGLQGVDGGAPGGTGCLRAQPPCLCSTCHDVQSGGTSAATVRGVEVNTLDRRCGAARAVELDSSHTKRRAFSQSPDVTLFRPGGCAWYLIVEPQLELGHPTEERPVRAQRVCVCVWCPGRL